MKINSFSIGHLDEYGQENFSISTEIKNTTNFEIRGILTRFSLFDQKRNALESKIFSIFGKNLEEDVGFLIKDFDIDGEICLNPEQTYLIDFRIPVLSPDNAWGAGKACRVDTALYTRETFDLGEVSLTLNANEQASLSTRIETDRIDPNIRALISCRQEDNDSDRRILVNCGIQSLWEEKIRVDLGYTLIGDDGSTLIDDDGEVCGGIEGAFLDDGGETVLRHDWWLDHMIERLAPKNVSRIRLTLMIYSPVCIISGEREHTPS